MSRVYCSDAARLRIDDPTATAARVDVWILVELPITWGFEPMTDSAFPSPVREALTRATKEIARSRVVFIRKRVECLGPTRVIVVKSAPSLGMETVDVPSIDDVAHLPFPVMAEALPPASKPVVLVCTHGQHDSCCGRRGYPLYESLRRREELEVWQCSHIGGDRFAANAVVLPWGLYYGPVETRDAEALAASIASREVFLPGYRGRSTMSRPAQAAETFLRNKLGMLGIESFRVLGRRTLEDGLVRVRLRDEQGTRHEVTVEVFVATESALLACASTTATMIRQFRIVDYRASSE